MTKQFVDYEDGDVCFSVSDNMAMDSDGNLMMRLSENMTMDLDSGDVHFVSGWPNSEDDD